MADPKNAKRGGPRGTRAEVEAVRRSAEAAGSDLDREQEKSVVHLAKALEEINEGEALAHIDTRLTFIERQVERLGSRRDEVDRSVQGELGIMRTRIEEALTAVGATAEETKDSWVSLEKRLTALIAQVERRSTGVVEAIRREVVTKVETASTRLEKYEARLRGEMKTFEEESEERARSLGESISESRRDLESVLESRLTELDKWVREAAGDFTRRLAEATANFENRLSGGTQSLEEMSDRTARLEQRLAKALKDFEAQSAEASAEFRRMTAEARAIFDSQFAEANGAIDQRIARAMASVNEKVARITGTVDEILAQAMTDLTHKLSAQTEVAEQKLAGTFDRRLESAKVDVQGLLDNERREIEGRLSETFAEVRMETQRVRDTVDEARKKFEGLMEAHKKDTLQRIRASEEKAAGAAIHLESMIIQQRRQMASDEAEWSGGVKESLAELAELRNRVEEMAGRVSTLDARWATERGSSSVAFEGLTGRLDLMEESVRDVVEEVSAKQATRVEMLASQVASLAEAEVSAEERFGSVEYLKRRMNELGERIDEIVVKVNALGRFVTKPLASTPATGSGAIPAELTNRIALVEKAVSDLGKKKAPQPAAESTSRVDALEKKLADLSKAQPAKPAAADGARMAELEKKLADLAKTKPAAAPDGTRLEALEKKIAEISKAQQPAASADKAKIEALEKQVAALSSANGPAAQDAAKKMAALEKKLDELSKAKPPAPGDALKERIDSVEKQIKELAKPAANGGPTPEVMKQVQTLEKRLAEVTDAAKGNGDSELTKKVDALARAVASLSNNVSTTKEQLSARVEELEKKTPVADAILPQPKRGIFK
jgi:chromosome segregation ATPase